jgi:HAD superfamily hydrolase (TIGR01509 family)
MFLYFDLGNVLLHFDYEIGCRQVAEVSGISPGDVRRLLFSTDFLARVETGALSSRQAYDEFCEQTGAIPDPIRLETAASAIFHLNHSMLPVVTKLKDAGYRLGLLSNTSESHWRYICAHFKALFPDSFDVLALSFRLGAVKPHEQIFIRAAELAGVPPREIFYCDDLPSNVAAARSVGFDAVQYTETPALIAELRSRGVRFNY